MFLYFFVLFLSLLSQCNAMTDDQLILEGQNQWVREEDSFKNECTDGALFLNHQQLLIIIKEWHQLISNASNANKTLPRSEKRRYMHALFDNSAKGFHPKSALLLKNPLLNDNFAHLTWRAEDLNLRDFKIALLQRIILEISTPDNFEKSYGEMRHYLMGEISQGRSSALYDYLKKGYPVNIIINKLGDTALIKAVKSSCISAVKLLIACPNLIVNAQDFTELNTALHWAIKRGNQEIFELILSHPLLDINIKNSRGKTALMLAAEFNKRIFVEKILEKFPHVDLTRTNHVGHTVFGLANQSLLPILSQHQLSLLAD